jgi:hypothetical protein
MAAKSPFEHINAICGNQRTDYYDNLSDEDKKSFNLYVITMGISMNPDFLPLANEVNKYWGQLDARSTYLFYSQIIPKGKYYNKWVKGKKEDTYEKWLVERIAEHFQCGKSDAITYLDIFYKTDDGREQLKEILAKYGTDPKKIKKAKI